MTGVRFTQDGNLVTDDGQFLAHIGDEAVDFGDRSLKVTGKPAPVTADQISHLGFVTEDTAARMVADAVASAVAELTAQIGDAATHVPVHDHPATDKAVAACADDVANLAKTVTANQASTARALDALTDHLTAPLTVHAGNGHAVPLDCDVAVLQITAPTAVAFTGPQPSARIFLVIHNPDGHEVTFPDCHAADSVTYLAPVTFLDYIHLGSGAERYVTHRDTLGDFAPTDSAFYQ
jgi:protein tyrosine phosphatase (PTP) superfamily phosphohydrolase (DUF442 family)